MHASPSPHRRVPAPRARSLRATRERQREGERGRVREEAVIESSVGGSSIWPRAARALSPPAGLCFACARARHDPWRPDLRVASRERAVAPSSCEGIDPVERCAQPPPPAPTIAEDKARGPPPPSSVVVFSCSLLPSSSSDGRWRALPRGTMDERSRAKRKTGMNESLSIVTGEFQEERSIASLHLLSLFFCSPLFFSLFLSLFTLSLFQNEKNRHAALLPPHRKT